jgi:hypothetical protein
MWLSEQGGIEPETAKRMDDVCCADLSTAAVGACDERTVAVGNNYWSGTKSSNAASSRSTTLPPRSSRSVRSN